MGTGTPGRVSGTQDSGTRGLGRGDACMVGRGDVGTWGGVDVGKCGRGDSRTWGLGNVGTQGWGRGIVKITDKGR